jgi:peptidoglycan/xylan/chitin deacetylase (PgdA/CDA1 family)
MNPLFSAVPVALAAAAGFTAYGAVSPRSQFFGRTLCYTPSPRQLALTFDDGPNPAITPGLLDLLDRHDARATFFVIGRFVRECPDLVREIAARGHAIGNHTETHPNLFWLGRARLRDEFRRCQEAIASVVGVPPVLMRPPFGIRNPLVNSAAWEVGIRSVVMWTLIPGDWRQKPADWLVQRMKPIADRAEHARQSAPVRPGGDVLCLHDGDHTRLNGDRQRTLAALGYWLPRWRDLGLEFVTIAPAAGEGTR